jgi:hypothetical protein
LTNSFWYFNIKHVIVVKKILTRQCLEKNIADSLVDQGHTSIWFTYLKCVICLMNMNIHGMSNIKLHGWICILYQNLKSCLYIRKINSRYLYVVFVCDMSNHISLHSIIIIVVHGGKKHNLDEIWFRESIWNCVY